MNDTVPTTPAEPETCDLAWCDQPPDHQDNHVRLIGLVKPTPHSPAVSVLVTVEAGPAETDPLPVLRLVDKTGRWQSARLSWREAGELASLLDVAGLRAGASAAGLLESAIEDHDPDATVQRTRRDPS